MKSPRIYALWMSLLVLVLVWLGMAIQAWTALENSFFYFVGMGLVIALVVFLVNRFLFVRYVEKEIDPIIKILQSYSTSKNQIRRKIDKEEIKKLRKTEKYRKDFLGNVSHELKTPIFNIQGYILTLLDGGIDDDNINKLYLKRAERSTNRLINIGEDLDAIARLESGEFKLNLESFNLVKVVVEVLEYQEMQAREKGIKIGFDGSYGKPIRVRADKKRIMEVIGNLVSNSIKYGREGGKTTIGFLDTGENILVDITDNGIGVNEKYLPRIFERFYRVDKSRSRESGGTGLGLSIVKHTLQAHKQTITVRSRVGQGTTFLFSLDKG
ncbi:MAG: sensor histidine kinase [Bacteroidales bacterium]|nr:sensor histidine kinase [Bacteroidales bacterium]